MKFESIPAADAASSNALLNEARFKLAAPERPERAWPAIAAAAFFAVAALMFATASILAPPLGTTPAAKTSVK
jgi:hypothetical protein